MRTSIQMEDILSPCEFWLDKLLRIPAVTKLVTCNVNVFYIVTVFTVECNISIKLKNQ